MTYNSRFIRLDWQFQAIGTDEIAETSCHLSGGPGWDGQAAFAEITSANAETLGQYLYSDVLNQTSTDWGSYSMLTAMKISLVETNGTIVTDPLVHPLTTPRTGSASNVPIQCSLLISLWSGYGVGVANYGRMYIPHTRSTLGTSSPYIGSAFVTALGGYFHTFAGHIQSFAQGLSNQADLALVSKKGTGTTKAVAYTRVGRVVDTQRRRYNALDPAYVATAL